MENNKQTRESLRMQRAFTYYFNLGHRRDLKQVAKKFHVSVRTVERLSAEFNWETRLVEWNNRIAEEAARKAIKEIADTRQAYHQIIQAGIERFYAALTEIDKEGNPVMRITVSDFCKLVSLDLALIGEEIQQENQE